MTPNSIPDPLRLYFEVWGGDGEASLTGPDGDLVNISPGLDANGLHRQTGYDTQDGQEIQRVYDIIAATFDPEAFPVQERPVSFVDLLRAAVNLTLNLARFDRAAGLDVGQVSRHLQALLQRVEAGE